MPPNQQNGGKKFHHFLNLVEQCGGFGFWIFRFKIRVVVKSGGFIANWWNLSHHISNCGGTLTTTYHIQGAGAPAKTKNYVNADAFIFFREKVRPFPHLAKPISRTFGKDEKAMVQIKRDWFDIVLENYERGEMHGRWKEKIQV